MMHQNRHLLLRTVLPRRHSFAASAAPARTAAVAFIGLGGNIGDRAGNLLRALRELEALPSTRLLDTSRLYESAPMYVEAQPRFLNAAALLETRLSPCELLGGLKRIKRLLGRNHHSGMRNGATNRGTTSTDL